MISKLRWPNEVLVERTVRCTKFESEVAGVICFDRVSSLVNLLAVDAFITLVLPGTSPVDAFITLVLAGASPMESRDFPKFLLPSFLIVQLPDRAKATSF